MKIKRRFTQSDQDVFAGVKYEQRTSRITNPDGSVVFEMTDAEIPESWSQLATDIMVSKYFRKAGVPQTDADGNPKRDEQGNVVTGPEHSAKQVIHRLAGCWKDWGEQHGYFDTSEDAQAFYDELCYMLLRQMCAPNSPQWFNTGLNFAYGITGPAQGHYYCDPATGEMRKSDDAYTHPQPHACFIQSVNDDLVNPGGIMDLWTREARLFKYGSGTGSNFSKIRGENESLSGGGKSSGLMSFLKIGDRAAGAIKSGGTTRRAAKMVCLDLDHPDVEPFINWKVREELKVAAMVEGLKVLPKHQRDTAARLGLKLEYDFNGEAYQTVSGQNSNNSVRIPNRFFKAVQEDGPWHLTYRQNGKVSKTLPARTLWEQIAFAAWRCADPGVQYDDTINQWHTCPKSGRINASNPCVTGDTRVLTPGGIWRRIDQMIHLPGRLITNLRRQAIGESDGSFPTGRKEVFELRTAGGYRLKLTGDHQVWTRRRGWVPACELTPADEVKLPSVPACLERIGEPREPRFFQMLGISLSRKNTAPAEVNLEACLEDGALIDAFAEYAHDQELCDPYRDDYINTAMVHTGSSGEGTMTARLTSRRLISRLGAYVRREAGHKRLSDEAFTAGLPAQKHLLKGLFTADAQWIDGTLQLTHDSRALLEDVQLLLLGFGIKATCLQPNSRGALPDTDGTRYAEQPRHGLRIDPGSLRLFERHIGMCDTEFQSASQEPQVEIPDHENWDAFASLTSLGVRQVFDLTETTTHSFIANGLSVHNCSEYMFLDDTACNLASFNILKFYDARRRTFDIEGYRHAIRLWTIVLEISVLMASFPSRRIAELSYRYRTLGLGYANLGAMLMQAGISYNSDKGRAICAALTAILTGESYAASAEMAGELGAFPGYEPNRADMLRVIRNHRRAAWNVSRNPEARKTVGEYESLDIRPVGIDASQFSEQDSLAGPALLEAARKAWDSALELGEKQGFRNAQTTVIAPTGTIGLLMDCDTTGVEPDFALVKFKKLSGGGYFKIANQSLKPALASLGYTPDQSGAIIRYVMGTLSLRDAPHINWDSLKLAGFTDEELKKVEASLPAVFELGFAFTPWTLGEACMKRLGIDPAEYTAPGFNLLRKLGFSHHQIAEANEVICGRGTVEGAPHLKAEHLDVFDCANKCGRHGTRFIPAEGHIRMMAAAQPFISGAISKTINLPNEAAVEDIKNAYLLSWELGLKANALYRDGSKLSQPLNIKSDEELDAAEADDEENVAAAREELAADAARAAALAGGESKIDSDNLSPVHTNVVEKIIERIVERPLRRRLPDTRNALTHKFDVAGHEGYITVGLYEDGTPGEVFITMAKEGSTIGGLMDTVATLVSVSLQYGVPVESLVRKFEHVRFEPSGMTRNREIPIAKSLVDYIFRWLAMEFMPGYRAANAPKRPEAPKEQAVEVKPSNGHDKPRADESPRPFDYGSGLQQQLEQSHSPADAEAAKPAATSTATVSRLAAMADPLSQQGSEMQADAPACDVCGSITVRSGTCYKCLNCGNSMGCS